MQRLLIANGRPLAPLAEGAPIDDDGFVWIDGTHDEIDQIAQEIAALTGQPLFENHLLDAHNLGHPSFFDSTSEYELIVFRALVANEEDVRITTLPVFVFRFERLIATVHAPGFRVSSQVRERLATHPGRPPRSTDEIAHRMLSGVVDAFLDLRPVLSKRMERWQRELFDPRRPFKDWYGLLGHRNEIRTLEFLAEGQLDTVREWRDARFEEMNTELQVRLADLVEHIERVRDHARRIDNQIESAVQFHFSAVSHRTSEVMRTLTVITAIFMPLTLITGIFGMNFELIPGLHSGHGFWITLVAMGAIVLGMLAWFRYRRWV